MKDYYAGRPSTERRDCVVRAFTILTEKPYAEVHAAFRKAGRKSGTGTKRYVTDKVAKQFGLVRVHARGTVATFLKDVETVSRLAAFVSGHAFGVIKGNYYDARDQAGPKQRVQFYYVKE